MPGSLPSRAISRTVAGVSFKKAAASSTVRSTTASPRSYRFTFITRARGRSGWLTRLVAGVPCFGRSGDIDMIASGGHAFGALDNPI